jgi:hypothetical protein
MFEGDDESQQPLILTGMKLEVWEYFYLITKDLMVEDPRDLLDYEAKIVQLGGVNRIRLINGITFGRYLIYIRNKVIEKSSKGDSLRQILQVDPACGGLTDSLQMEHKRVNWGILTREFRKFGIQLAPETRDKIIGGDKKEIMELFRFIMVFDKFGGCEVFAETLQVANEVGNLPPTAGFKPITKLPFININFA